MRRCSAGGTRAATWPDAPLACGRGDFLWCRFRAGSFDAGVKAPAIDRAGTGEPHGADGAAPESTNASQEDDMRVMVIVKANSDSEAGIMPSTEMLTAMGKYNEELVKAGIMLAGEGLQPSVKGKRVRFSGRDRTVIDGPFAETKELIAGFWLWQVKSMDEAVEWVRRCPNPMEGESFLEIRPVFESEDFGDALTPELREQEDRLRAQIAKG